MPSREAWATTDAGFSGSCRRLFAGASGRITPDNGRHPDMGFVGPPLVGVPSPSTDSRRRADKPSLVVVKFCIGCRKGFKRAFMQFSNVTAHAKANVYFDGKVVSHTILFADGTKKTLGLIYRSEEHTSELQSRGLIS